METNFFRQIAELNLTGNIRLNIQPQVTGEMIVSLLLDTSHVTDKAAKQIPPLILKGSYSDLDAGFFTSITDPVQTTQTLLVNMQAHTVAMEKANKESRIVKDKEEEQKKAKDSKKKRFEEQMKKVDELVKHKKIGEAIGQLPDLKIFPEYEAEIKKKGQELRGQHGTLSLFGEEPSIDAASTHLEVAEIETEVDSEPKEEEFEDEANDETDNQYN